MRHDRSANPRAALPAALMAFVSLLFFPSPGPVHAAAPTPSDRVLAQDGREFILTFSEDLTPTLKSDAHSWISFMAGALRQIYGHWPRQKQAISVYPVSAADDDPIPWAEVHRGEVDRIDFFISPRASAATLKQSWTGYHEMAHLLIPYRGWGDAWFSEGLATYYQNLMLVRSGVISEQRMWQNLLDGFQRGRRDDTFRDQNLQSASDQLREEGGFMRVYWSGAWYFLVADTRLRQQSGGTKSLDLALAELNACCANQSLSVPEMVERLDTLNRVVLFAPLYREIVQTMTVPPWDPLFASLGITVMEGEVVLQNEGPGARLRHQISRHNGAL